MWRPGFCHWGGPDPVVEEEKDFLTKIMYIYDCTWMLICTLLSNKCLTKSMQLNIAIAVDIGLTILQSR